MSKVPIKSAKKGNQQYAALPVRHLASGEPEVLLLTSRGTKRWVVPKGWPMLGRSPAETAATEAYEEAGIKGRIIGPTPIGRYYYDKQLVGGGVRTITVDLFLLEVVRQLATWPEQAERETHWFKPKQAEALVAEPDLATILGNLMTLLVKAGLAPSQPLVA
ncbi:NUDIX hydrolase [Acidisphaera sp. L21]|uniref:NUDIX hydrolase n=1 Tax=Acidisphaera sp. L21 TaxID=1641851 RepID=UPI001C2076A9|nr:NUDIX hydrolase [Acidisphaera sp. L21]